MIRTCARLADNVEDGGGGAVLQATGITLCLLARRVEQLTGQIRTWNAAWPGSWDAMPRSLLAPLGIARSQSVDYFLRQLHLRFLLVSFETSPPISSSNFGNLGLANSQFFKTLGALRLSL
ncbi:hypothetical protein ACWIGX_19395 [Streptomyces nigrescens]